MKTNIFLRVLIALIFFQTLYFKFSAAPESVFIFTQLGVEPWGRVLSGVIELIIGLFILIPKTQILAALISLAVISGALLSHIFIIGIEVQDDHGLLFSLALIIFFSCLTLLWRQRKELNLLIKSRLNRVNL